MHNTKNGNKRLLSMSRVAPKRDTEEMDTVIMSSQQSGDRRAFDILMEAQHYWNQMEDFRKDRERNKRYTYGFQWDDKICVDGETMTEEEYIKRQGNVPLKNNLIRRLVKSVLGVYRSQSKEPTCTARDRDEQKLGETMSTILQCNMQLNRMTEVYARTMEEFLISGFIVHRKSYGWRNGKEDCWTDYVQPNNFFIDNNMRDFRGWDVSVLGEIHDISFGQLCEQFASSPEDYRRLRDIYKWAAKKEYIASYAERFGYSRLENYDFLFTSEPGRCRVIEVWRKEQKPRYRCHDYQNGDIFKIDVEDYQKCVVAVNDERIEMAKSVGMPEEEVPLVKATWFIDDYWYFYYLSPFGDILKEGETPYEHDSHPYVFKAYPFIDGEIHSFVADVIDQQRYTNRLITLYDWIMRASAKGVLLMPEDCLPDGVSIDDIAESWAEFNGVIVYRPSKNGRVPEQVANNSTNIGIAELLNMQLKFFEDISGVTGALQGKPGFSGESAAHFQQQTQNATTTLLDLLECFSGFVVDGAYKDVKNIQQFYDSKRVFNIAGRSGAQIEYDPKKVRDVEFDLSITESTTTPAYRHLANDILMQLWQAQAISVEQLLEHGDFPFADELLQSIKSQKEQLEQGKMPDGLSPELMAQVQQGANMQAVNKLNNAMRQ
ncbi:MAG: portal protein [Bacteriophage sp.]|nr:MAG: portal protein [Bacteriophage sp.]UWG79734.1 MAG: portal protein [Bacteriophage sp.]UWH98651.1 MAG: portal protein [Bacteriophage sp.]UWI27335.1 MAG: portal protein [Bacteriophage sp.]